ncbi:hypothetical protein CBR_g17873 [Chara braunii]|uniref:RNA-directed DNA polymerase n=1 Tax=Chara braunii TaxID=69332 RepID=A0A388KVS0_CHABU|nr:hypothetical protein CBR_g17873 [Chara braunii]|eukprot:GBG74160.1 hypothetical protein CBR_g17873 [Chara braunii]
MLQARQQRLTLHVFALRRLLTILFDPDRTLPIIPVRLGTSTRVYSALWDSGSRGDFVHPCVVKEVRLPTTGLPTPISVTLGDDKTQRFFDHMVTDLPFFLTLEPTDRSPASRRHRSSAHFDVMETGYDFILGTPWSRRFRSTEVDWATNTLVLKTKCGQTYRVPFIGTTATPRPDPPPPEPSVPTPSSSITVTSLRQFAHFIRQDDVTFFMVNVTDLLHYDPPCHDAELISLEPDPPSISMAPISTFVPPPSAESTPPSCADADAEELAQYTVDLEPTVCDLIREYHDVFPLSFSYASIPPMRNVEHSIQLVSDYRVHHQAPYTLSIPEAIELKRHLEELLSLGFIKPSNSPWDAPVLFAFKVDETLRVCIDCRGLNRYTVKNSYPMPRSDDLFDRLAGNRFFTKIDLRSGYHQIRVVAVDQLKTAFRSRFGHYEFTVRPHQRTCYLQRAMNDIFKDTLEQYVLVYLDDILVYSHASDFVVGTVLSQVFPSSPDSSHPRIPRFPPPTPTTASRLTPTCPATDEPSIDYSPTIAEDGTVESRSGDCPIAFYSRQLLPAEINYTADEGEVLTVVYAARHWRHYLHGAPFTVRTDNSVVQVFFTKPKLTPRKAHWWSDLSEFSFTTEHIKGETNRVADALSRRPDHDQEQIQLSSISVTSVHHSVIDEFRTQYRHCPDYRDIHVTLRSGKTVPNYSLRDNGLVYWHGSQGTREPRICVPSTGQLRVRAVAEFHDQAVTGHMGFHKTLPRVSRLHVWPKRKDFVKDYVAECPTCQEVNSVNHLPYGLLQPLPIPEGRWQSISMDFIVHLRPPTPRGHDAILVVVDRFTTRARFVPCCYAISAREVVDIVFDRVVPPLLLVLPLTVGQTEITNRTLGDILRKIVRDDQQWDLHLAHAEIAYNHAVLPATGMSPYYCDLGYHPRVPADFLQPSQMHPDTSCLALDDWVAHMTSIMKTAHDHIAASQTRMAACANRSRMDHPFKVSDVVLIDAPHLQLEADTLHKFRRRFFGPCRILQAVGSGTASSPVSFRVKLPDYLRQARVHDVYHVSLLCPYRRPSERFAGRPYERPPPIMVDGHEEFLVSDIIGRRVTDNNPPHVEYLVHWKGYPNEEATWEPLEHLQHARMLVRAYDRARRVGFTAPPQPTDLPSSPAAEETAEVEPPPSEADLQRQPDASERPQRTRRHPARYDD